MQREFGNLLAIQDNYPKIVVTMESLQTTTTQGVVNMDLRSFLMTQDF